MTIKEINRFDLGLVLGPPNDTLADGAMRSNRGQHALSVASIRSRPGSTLIHSLNAHSLHYFNDTWYSGVSTSLYSGTTEIQTGLSGDRLALSRMAPVAGIADYLFVADGSDLFKVDSSNNITDWGFDPPASDPSIATAAGGALEDGKEYQYKITYKNSTTGHRSNANTNAVSATPSGANLTINLTSIPDGSLVDSQIDTVEIWRTVGDGSAFFLLTTISAGTTSYSDTGAATLSSTELPTDNLKPYDSFFECLGPHNASMFWLSNASGQRGRLYYSPIGRAESLAGFIEVTSDDRPLKKIFRLQGQLGVIGESGIFLIGGTNPYVYREIPGCPGTNSPHTVTTTPYGLFYEAPDGIRIFDGATSKLVNPGSIERIFQGGSVADLTSFTGVVGAYARGEYFISDTSQTLAFDFAKQRFRDVGVGMNAVYYADESDQLAATVSSTILDFENEGATADNGSAISFIAEPGHIHAMEDRYAFLQYIILDIDTSSEQVTLTLLHDTSSTTIGVINTSAREIITLPTGIAAKLFGVRFTASLTTGEVEIFNIKLVFADEQTG